jgi:hypothetical protein
MIRCIGRSRRVTYPLPALAFCCPGPDRGPDTLAHLLDIIDKSSTNPASVKPRAAHHAAAPGSPCQRLHHPHRHMNRPRHRRRRLRRLHQCHRIVLPSPTTNHPLNPAPTRAHYPRSQARRHSPPHPAAPREMQRSSIAPFRYVSILRFTVVTTQLTQRQGPSAGNAAEPADRPAMAQRFPLRAPLLARE